MKQNVFLLINSIDLERGGLTRASIKQANTFSEMGYQTFMLTFNFNPRYPSIRHELLEMGKIREDVKILNMYEEFEGHSEPILLNNSPVKADMKKLTGDHPYNKRKGRNAYRVFENGLYTKYISLRSDNSLDFIDYFNENRHRTKREVYDLWQNLKKIIFMDLSLNKPRQIIYYREDGSAYLNQWVNPETDKIQRSMFFNNKSEIIDNYVNDTLSPKTDWVNSIVSQFSNPSIIISDTRGTDDVLAQLNSNNVKKLWRLHSGHLKDQNEPIQSEITSPVKYGFDHIEDYDVAVLLTDEQKNDFQKRLDHVNTNFVTIPHFHDDIVSSKGNKLKKMFSTSHILDKDVNLAVIVSRLSSIKQINHSIQAFSQVVKEIPSAKLEIWGTGKEENKLSKLIEKHGLEQNISLKGYTHSPDEIYQKGLFSILTSKSEGFALSVMESMYNYTPVLSYKIKYGPKDMINHDQNGYLIEQNDIDELANKMIHLFQNPNKAINMGEDARKYIEKNFNKELYKQRWSELFEQLND